MRPGSWLATECIKHLPCAGLAVGWGKKRGVWEAPWISGWRYRGGEILWDWERWRRNKSRDDSGGSGGTGRLAGGVGGVSTQVKGAGWREGDRRKRCRDRRRE